MTVSPPEDIVRAVHAELAVPGRYHLHVTRAHRSFFEQALQWVWAHVVMLWDSLMRHVHIGRSGLADVGDGVIVLCVLAIAAVAAHLLVQVQLDRVHADRSVEFSPARSAQTYVVAAAGAAADGDYARAVRLLFIAAVTLLDIRGVVHDERGATINDLRRALATRDAVLEASFVDIARIYTSAAYAERPLDADAWQRAQAAYARLKERSLA